MIEMAEKRNGACADRACFTASIEDAKLEEKAYDKVFAIHVAALHNPGKPLEVVARCLAPEGLLYLFDQSGVENASGRPALRY